MRMAVVVVVLVVCGCSSSATLVAIDVTPGDPTVAEGATVQLSAAGMYSDGSTQDLPSVDWSSSDVAAATVAGAGFVSGVAIGTSVISATTGGVIGSTPVSVTAQIVVDPGHPGATIWNVAGARSPENAADFTDASYVPAFTSIPISLVSYGDGGYHWQTNVGCNPGQSPGIPAGEMGTPGNPNGDFDHFETLFAQPAGFEVMVHVPIGTNPTCDGRGDPAEAAAWVDYANNQQHYGVKYWQLGLYPDADDNGDFGSPPYISTSPALYASIANQYIAAMKAKDATIRVGLYLAPARAGEHEVWDSTLLSLVHGADFVTTWVHAETFPGNPNDQDLVTSSATNVKSLLATIHAELAAAGVPDLPILIDGVEGNFAQSMSQQATSITSALYYGQVLAEIASDGAAAIGPFGTARCEGPATIVPSEYGWQDFVSHTLVARALPTSMCPDAPAVPAGTIMPVGRAFQLAAQFATPGERALPASVGGQPSVRAFAATHGAETVLFLFNLDENITAMPSVALSGPATSFAATAVTYGKAEYDQSQTNVWAAPVTMDLGTLGNPFHVALAPWSMTVLTLTSR